MLINEEIDHWMATDAFSLQSLAWGGLVLFLATVVSISVVHSRKLFFSRHGWSHRLLGGLLLIWLFMGVFSCHACSTNPALAFGFDAILGILGIGATLTAAKEFPHKYIQNETGQSGTLHHMATVTQSEMLEHAFYQGLNLLQAFYLHMMHRTAGQGISRKEDSNGGWQVRLALLWVVTSPWLVRRRLPVHSFSDNWRVYSSKRDGKQTKGDLEIFLYRIKKAQYLFYKHVILHGINIYEAVVVTTNRSPRSKLPPYSLSWRVFWQLLYTSYVSEFFLQSLVKRRVMGQTTMLLLQRWLMTSASISAAVVLWQIIQPGATPGGRYFLPAISVASLILNFINRRHDVLNTMGIAALAMTWRGWREGN